MIKTESNINNAIIYKDGYVKIFLKNGICKNVIAKLLSEYINEIEYKKDYFPFTNGDITIMGLVDTIKFENNKNIDMIIKILKDKNYIVLH